MKKLYPSKKAKRRAEYLERKKKRDKLIKEHSLLNNAETIEEMAFLLGIKLK